MYQISDFSGFPNDNKVSFIKLLKSKWEEICSKPNVFRYKINNIQERITDGKYLLLLNPDRSTNRRQPECIDSICQPYDAGKFNFTKVSKEEILFGLKHKSEEHSLIVNVSPILNYHTLLCPAVNKKLPQVVTEDSLSLVLEVMFLIQDCHLKVAFNSLCAFASVNHLHYHLLFQERLLPVELVKWKQLKGPLHSIQDYIVSAFCFEVKNDCIEESVAQIYKLIKYLLDKNIAHNILMTMAQNVCVYVFPRKSVMGAKQFNAFNVATYELSGWMIVHSAEGFHSLQTEDIETELKKWEIDHFDTLCEEVKQLY